MTPGDPPASAAMFSPYLKQSTLIATNRTSGHKVYIVTSGSQHLGQEENILMCNSSIFTANPGGHVV
jgi:hypothetical protein